MELQYCSSWTPNASQPPAELFLPLSQLQPAVRYVEEGLFKAATMPADGEAADEAPATKLEVELRSVLGVMKAVQRSWCSIKKDSDEIGRALFCLVFERHPAFLKLFSFRDDPNWQSSAALKAHASAIMKVGDGMGELEIMASLELRQCNCRLSPPPHPLLSPLCARKTVGKLVGGLQNLQSVMPTLARLGQSHAARGITPAHFDVLREYLLETLALHLGPIRWTREVSSSWRGAFCVISAAIVNAFPGSAAAAQLPGGADEAAVAPLPPAPLLSCPFVASFNFDYSI